MIFRRFRYFLLSLSVLALTGGLIPEAAAQGGLQFGLDFGPTFTSLDATLVGGEPTNFEPTIGFHAGLILGYDAGHVAVISGVHYVYAGTVFDGSSFTLPQREEFEVVFVTVPVDVQVLLRKSGRARPYLFGGPEFRYAVNLEDKEFNVQDDLDLLSTTFSIGAGIRLRVPGLGSSLSPQVQYTFDRGGFYDGELSRDDGGVSRTADKLKANMLRLGLVLGL